MWCSLFASETKGSIAVEAEDIRSRLHRSTVGIIGLGGLGSNVAWMLVRSGVRRFVLADPAAVESRDLDRQYYFADQVGIHKTEALSENLRRIDPSLELMLVQQTVDQSDVAAMFREVDVLVEAVDTGEARAQLISAAARDLPHIPVVAASGLAGSDSANLIISQRVSENLWVTGDLEADVSLGLPLLSSRVTVAAAHQAHLVVRILLGESEP